MYLSHVRPGANLNKKLSIYICTLNTQSSVVWLFFRGFMLEVFFKYMIKKNWIIYCYFELDRKSCYKAAMTPNRKKGQFSVWTSSHCSELIEARKVSAEVFSGQIITFHQAHSNSLHPPAQNKLYRLNPFLPTPKPFHPPWSIKSYDDFIQLVGYGVLVKIKHMDKLLEFLPGCKKKKK